MGGNSMKIAISTITDGANYGNRLQNYALQHFLESLGYDVETIRRKTSRDKSFVGRLFKVAKDIIKYFVGKNTFFCQRYRKKRFEKFNSKYIKFSKYILFSNQYPQEINDAYDYFVFGSDQIWNSRIGIIKEDLNNHLGQFCDGSKRVAYAASFGTSDVEEHFKDIYAKELSKFHSISVRENDGQGILEELCKRKVPVVADPTMLLNVLDWNKIARKPRYINVGEKYILTYFLGKKNEKMKKYMSTLAKDKNCRLINLGIEFMDDRHIDDKKIFSTTPDEFVWLISNAECVLTDSYHASVFSIIYEKPFVVFGRYSTEKNNDMSGRIDTLLDLFDLKKHKDNVDSPSVMPVWDGVDTKSIFNREKKRATEYISKALGGN